MAAAEQVTTTLAQDLALEHPSAIRIADQLATIPNPGERRRAASAALAERRTALSLLRTLLVERDGNAAPLARIIAGDVLYAELAILTTA